MCGRLVLTSNYTDRIRAIFSGVDVSSAPPASFNITPGRKVPVIVRAEADRISWLQWGMPGAGSRTAGKPPSLLINARAETIHRLPSFRESFARSRGLILADGFYEWKRDPALKRPQPYYFRRKDGQMLLLAGLWENASDTCAVITTEANGLMHAVHDRMPVIFSGDSGQLWLEADTNPETLRTMLQPCPSDELTMHPVSTRVNKAGVDDPSLIDPVAIHEQTQWF